MIDLDNIEDEWGGIDEGIKPLVFELNRLGFPTSGSCEGHIDHGYPGPWVSIHPAEGESEKLMARMSALLAEFYAGRDVPPEERISILPGHNGFWIYAGGEKFIEFREFINAYAKRKAEGEDSSKPELSEEEKARREKLLPKLQAEINSFVLFLKKS